MQNTVTHPLKAAPHPLENELKQLQDPEVIQLLVENGDRMDVAKKLAAELGDLEIDDAMQSKQKRSKVCAAIVNLVTALIFFILAWANSVVLTGIPNKIFKKFEISSNKDSDIAKKKSQKQVDGKSRSLLFSLPLYNLFCRRF